MVKEGYKKTEAGVIPEEWQTDTFQGCFDTLPNNTLSRAELNYNGGTVKNIHYGDVLIKFPAVTDCQKEEIPYVNRDCVSKLGTVVLHDKDVIIADTAEDETVGKATELINVGDQRIVSGLHTIPCRPKQPEQFASKWLGYFINHRSYHNQLLPLITGTKVSSVSKSAIADTVIVIPERNEQERIVNALSDTDELIINLEQLISKKKDIRKGAMQELLTGKRRLPGFSDKWNEVELGTCGRFVSGNGFPLRFQGESDGKYPFYKVSDLNNKGNENYLIKANNYISQAVACELSCNIIPASSIVFAKIGAAIFLERKRIASCDCCIDNNMMAFVPFSNIVSTYIWLVFQTITLGDLAEVTALPSLSGKIIGSQLVTIPSDFKEQEAIATVITEMDSEIASLENKLHKYRQIKSGMMDELLTGKIRLTKEV